MPKTTFLPTNTGLPNALKNKKACLINLGCAKNQVDSENILGELKSAGYQISEDADSSLIVINTCGFIEEAKAESINEILTTVKHKKPNQKIVVAGCLSQRYKHELAQEIPEVDLFIGTYKTQQILNELNIDATGCDSTHNRFLLEKSPHHAYLKIAEGCNRICGFCAIPNMRGKQQSRSISDIVKEAQQLQSQGILELSLIAQDLTYYGREKTNSENLLELLKALTSSTDIPWIRLMYAYPAFIDNAFIEFMRQEPKVCNYLDMPIQHASNSVLQNMRRGYTRQKLTQLLKQLQTIPNMALRTTVLVGYPGETQSDYQQLLDFIQEIKFNRLGGFTYSPEDNTYAEESLKLPAVNPEIAQERFNNLMRVQQQISLEHNTKKIGDITTVLIDEKDNSYFDFIGRTEQDAWGVDNNVIIKDPHHTGAIIGTFRKVKITQAHEFDLEAELLSE